MNRIAGRATICLILALALLAGFGFFVVEFITQSGNWVVTSGSPHVYNGDNINCGVIVDRDGILLADLTDGRKYSNSLALRKSTIHWLGDRQGWISAPAISHYARQIAGFDLVSGVYNYADSSGVVELTLSSQIQQAALEALGSYKGTIAVCNYKTGQLLGAVTTPNYDPDDVPDIAGDKTGAYEGVYVNRFVQSTYIPGSIFKIVTLAAALETVADIQQQTFVCTGSYEINGEEITCEVAHGQQSLMGAFSNSCNCAFAHIALQVGAEKLNQYAKEFGVTNSVSFDGITTATGNFDLSGAAPIQVAWSGVGQYTDQINPCAYLTFLSAIANGGEGVNPYLVQQITVGSARTYQAQTRKSDCHISGETAKLVGEYMRNNVSSRYGDGNFPGLTVCAKTGTAQVGGEQKPNAMLAGFLTDENYPLAFIVCVEDAGYGSTVCIPMASKVLAACKSVLDS